MAQKDHTAREDCQTDHSTTVVLLILSIILAGLTCAKHERISFVNTNNFPSISSQLTSPRIDRQGTPQERRTLQTCTALAHHIFCSFMCHFHPRDQGPHHRGNRQTCSEVTKFPFPPGLTSTSEKDYKRYEHCTEHILRFIPSI